MSGIKKIHGIEFNIAAVKGYSKTEFVKVFKSKLGENSEAVYYELTGKKPPKGKDKGEY